MGVCEVSMEDVIISITHILDNYMVFILVLIGIVIVIACVFITRMGDSRKRMDLMAWLGIVLLLLISLVAYRIWRLEVPPNENVSIDLFGGLILLLSFTAGLIAYQLNKRHDEALRAENKREYFITDDKLKRIRMCIGHNDLQLQTIVAIVNIMDYSKPGLMTEKVMKFHEEFDSYLNYMEGVAILANKGSIMSESLTGLWSFYFKQLRQARLLGKDSYIKGAQITFNDITFCIDKLYEDDKKLAKIIKGEINKYAPTKKKTKLNDPVNLEPVHEIKKLNDPVDSGSVHPLEMPVWYYIINKGNEFDPIIKLSKKFWKKETKEVKPN